MIQARRAKRVPASRVPNLGAVVDRVAIQVTSPAAAQLRPFISSYVGYEMRGFPAGVHLGMPSRSLTAVVSLAEPLDIDTTGTGHSAERFSTIASGLASHSVGIHHDGSQHGVQISLTPFGARAIYGMPAAELVDVVVPLDEVLGVPGGEVVDRVGTASQWTERFAALDQLFVRAMGHVSARHSLDQVRPEVAEAWRQIVTSNGTVEINALARALGWSRRHLSEQFRREVGLSPKVAARILRFEQAHRLATRADPAPWAEIAAVAGYADQAHMSRDWHGFTDMSPTAWRDSDVLIGPEADEASRAAA